MGIDRLKQMPLAILIVFGRWCQYEAGSMSTHYRHLTIRDEGRVATTGDVQIGQAFGLNPYDGTSGLFCLNGFLGLDSWIQQHAKHAECGQ